MQRLATQSHGGQSLDCPQKTAGDSQVTDPRVRVFKVLFALLPLFLTGCFTLRARMNSKFQTTKGSEGTITIERSFPAERDAAACGASAMILGGWCWAYLFMPWLDQQDQMYELADELLAKNIGAGKYRIQDRSVKRIGYEEKEPTLKLQLKKDKGDIKDVELFDDMVAAEELGQVVPPSHPDERALRTPTWSGEAGMQMRLGTSFFLGATRRKMGYIFRVGTQIGNEQLILGAPLVLGGGYRKGLFSVMSSFSLFSDGGFRGIVYEKTLDGDNGDKVEGMVCERELPCKNHGVELERNASWTMLFYELAGRITTSSRYPIQGFFEAGFSWNIYTHLNVRSKEGDEIYGKPRGVASLYNENHNGIGFNGKVAALNEMSGMFKAGISIDFL